VQVVSCHNGKLQSLVAAELKGRSDRRTFTTGLDVLDALAPGSALARGTIHELLYASEHGEPRFFATVLAQHASAERQKQRLPIIWSDPRGELYPPAVAALGIDLRQLYLLRPPTPADETWAVTECLRCKGVGAVVAAPQVLSRVEARRLQLAAETGGGVGLLLRPTGKRSMHYAATTRWLVAPAPGERSVQRWRIQLLHGHGGRVGQTVFLECDRETHSLRATVQLADRPAATATPAARQRDTA
jgi:protein ImuA